MVRTEGVPIFRVSTATCVNGSCRRVLVATSIIHNYLKLGVSFFVINGTPFITEECLFYLWYMQTANTPDQPAHPCSLITLSHFEVHFIPIFPFRVGAGRPVETDRQRKCLCQFSESQQEAKMLSLSLYNSKYASNNINGKP